MRVGTAVATMAALVLAACSSRDGAAVPSSTVASTVISTITSAAATTTTVGSAAPALTASTAPVVATSTAVGRSTVFSFPSAAAIDGWRTQNDTVMGGVSTGERTWADGALVFEGELSLDNDGGFASLVSPPVDGSPWSAADGVRLGVAGDGRTYVLQLRLDGTPGGWVQPFATTAGSTVDVTLPWSGFAPVDRFLRPLRAADPLDPGAVRAVAVYLVEKRPGPFRLALHAVG